MLLPSDGEGICVSSLQHTGFAQLLIAIDAAIIRDPLVTFSFRFPQSKSSILASLEAGAVIEEKRFEGNMVFLQARGPASLLERYAGSSTGMPLVAKPCERGSPRFFEILDRAGS